MITIAIDSAMHSVGMALFKDGELRETALITIPKKIRAKECVIKMTTSIKDQIWNWLINDDFKQEPVELVIEDHEFRYKNEKMKVNTFANMYAVGVCVAYIFKQLPTAFYVPKVWKGTVPKEIMTERIMKRERDIGCRENLLWNGQDDVVDAIGIGRFHIDKIR